MKNTLRPLAKKWLYRAGYYAVRRRLAPPAEKKLVILMYHNLTRNDDISRREPIDDDSPTPSQFETQLRFLTRRYRVVSLRAAVDEIRCSGKLSEDSIAITFDDGNESVYTVAFPLLIKYDAPATVFVVSSWIEGGRVSWWHHLCELVEKADLTGVTAARIRDIFGPHSPDLPHAARTDFSARRRFVLGLEPSMRAMPDHERVARLDAFQRLLFPRGDFVPEESRILTWQQIEEMAGGKIDFESHTRTHVHIPTVEISAVEEEIKRSKTEIERHTRREVTGFAYPFGKDLASYVAVEPLLRNNGFAYACNACPGSNSASSNLYSMYRYALPLTTSEALIGRELSVFFLRK